MPKKKLIAFQTEESFRVIDAAIKDRAVVESGTESLVIEKALNSYLFPKNRTAAYWAEDLYKSGSLADAYRNVFGQLSAIERYRTHPYVGEFVRNFHLLASSSNYFRFRGNESDLEYLQTELNLVSEMYPATHPDRTWLLTQARKLTEDPADVCPQELVSVLSSDHQIVGMSTHTYRALCAIISIIGDTLRDTPRHRIAYIDTLDQISREW